MPADLLDPPPSVKDVVQPAEITPYEASDRPHWPDAAFFKRVDGVEVPDAVWEQAATVFQDAAAAAVWLQRPLGQFDGRAPLDLIRDGEGEEVWATLGRIAWGIPS